MSSDNTKFLVSRGLIMDQYPRCGSADLEGWIEDLRYALEGTDRFTRVRVRKTEENDRMVEASCLARGSFEGLVETLESVWERDIRYIQIAAHAITIDEQSVSLDVVTASGTGGCYITGRIVAHYCADRGRG